jgi:hypothetical protein
MWWWPLSIAKPLVEGLGADTWVLGAWSNINSRSIVTRWLHEKIGCCYLSALWIYKFHEQPTLSICACQGYNNHLWTSHFHSTCIEVGKTIAVTLKIWNSFCTELNW